MNKDDSFRYDEIILEPFTYLIANSGKGIRRKLITAFNHWLNISDSKLDLLGEVIEMLHNASLVIDDIEDASERRRGRPAAHMLFGIPMSINGANYAYFLAFEKALKLDHPDISKIFVEQMLNLHRGQGMDIYWRCAMQCPTESEYKQMVIKKTGGLFGMAVRLMQLFSSVEKDFNPLLDALGLWFQIRDDLANLVDTTYQDLKDFADDITEGKFSFPIIHAIQTHLHDHQVLSILRQRTSDNAVKQYCVQHLAELGSLTYTAQALVCIEEGCREKIRVLGGNKHLECFLDEYSKLYRLPTGEPKAAEFLNLGRTLKRIGSSGNELSSSDTA